MAMQGRVRAAAVLAFVAQATIASAQSADTVSSQRLFTPADFLLAGAVAAGAVIAHPLDDYFARRLQDSSTQSNRKLHNLALFVRTTAAPGSYIIGTTMYLVGRVSKEEHLESLGLHGTEALLVGEGVGGVLKGLFGRQRPFVQPRDPNSFEFLRGFGHGDDYRSFPSGHSVAAFAAAAAVTSETSAWFPHAKWEVGTVMFGGAALTGISRMYDNRHWASDVIIGAGIGTFAGLKVVRYHRTHPGNAVDRVFITASLVPSDNGGHALQWSLAPRPR